MLHFPATRKIYARRVLPDHSIIQRPDCLFPRQQADCFHAMNVHVSLDERLSILRAEDRFRTWASLDDRRSCTLCEKKFNGRQVEIRRFANGRYELHCPTEGCNSEPHQWVYPGKLLVSRVIERDWWRAIGKQSKRRLTGLSARAQGHSA